MEIDKEQPWAIFYQIWIEFSQVLYGDRKRARLIDVVGNINIGGTGKTSLAIEIYKILNKNFKTVFIKKKYANQKDEIRRTKANASTSNYI